MLDGGITQVLVPSVTERSAISQSMWATGSRRGWRQAREALDFVVTKWIELAAWQACRFSLSRAVSHA